MNLAILFAALPTLSVAAGIGVGVIVAGGPAPSAEPAAPAHDAEAAVAGAVMAGGEGRGDEGAQVIDRVVQLGRMTVPVQKARSVSYVVTDLGVSMRDSALAEEFRAPENAIRLRGAMLAALTEAATTPLMRGVSIDTEALAADIAGRIAQDFDGVDDVLFLSFYKADVPRV